MSKTASSEVLVCQSNSCRRAGSAAVLLDLEELTAAVSSDCKVRKSGCLSLCRRAPAALVVKKQSRTDRGSQTSHTRLQSDEAKARLVENATGRRPPLVDQALSASALSRTALNGRAQESRSSGIIAGLKKKAVAVKAVDEPISQRPPDGSARSERSPIWRNMLKAVAASKRSGGGAGGGEVVPTQDLPTLLERYSQWTVDRVVPVTAHSAVFHFSSTDVKRGTPHRRGRFRNAEPKTWHTTLVALVGKNEEGPLPFIERDYTPISGAKDWESGRCEILIKIYPDGLATSWLHRLCCEGSVSDSALVRPKIWLSPPVKTLSVPTLSEDPASAFRPASVLLLLAGTGVVALPQILAHRDPHGQLGIATREVDQMRVPIDVVFSSRRDDVLMLPEITRWCGEASQRGDTKVVRDASAQGIRKCMLLLTEPHGSAGAPQQHPFPSMAGGGGTDDLLMSFQSLPNCELLQGERLDVCRLAAVVSNMPRPCRFVISGPKGFNTAVREMLSELQVEEGAITILPA